MKKLILCIAACLFLSMGMLPMTALAEDPEMPFVYLNKITATVDNQADILGDGTCSLAYNSTDDVWELTLNGAALTSNVILGSSGRGGFGNFRIILQGNNTLTSTSDGISGGGGGDIEITGDGSLTITAGNYGSGIGMNSMSNHPDNGNLILNGANMTVNGGALAFNVTKSISILNGSDVDVSVVDPYNAAINASNNVTVSDSDLNVTATAESATSVVGIKTIGKDIVLNNSTVTVNANSNAVSAAGNLTIENTALTAASAVSTAVYAAGDMKISGTSTLDIDGYYRALQANNITLSGGTTDANSSNDIAVWALNLLTIDGGEIHAKGAEGYAAIGVRVNQQASETEPTPKIVLNENYADINGGKVAVSPWYESGNYTRSWTSFIAKDDEGSLATDRSNALNEVTIQIKSANYENVEAIIARIPADLTLYTDETVAVLNQAKDAVVLNLDITQQATVDSYVPAIEDAITKLAYKDANYDKVNAAIEKIPSDLSIYTDASVKALNDAKNAVVTGKNITEQAIVDGYAADIEKAINNLQKKTVTITASSTTDTTQTGDTSNAMLWIALLVIAGAAVFGIAGLKYRKGTRG